MLSRRRRNAGRHAYPYRRANEEALTATVRRPKHRRDLAVAS